MSKIRLEICPELRRIKGFTGEKSVEEDRLIEGFASTDTVDRTGDSIHSEAFREGLQNYLRNPILLYNHDLYKPIGRVLELSILPNGLYVKARISRGTVLCEEIWELIKQGTLSAFSICTTSDIVGEVTPDGIRKLNRWDLAEISVVTVPANPEAVFTISKITNGEYPAYIKKEVRTKMAEKKNPEGVGPEGVKPEVEKTLEEITEEQSDALLKIAQARVGKKIAVLNEERKRQEKEDALEREIKDLRATVEKIPVNSGSLPFPTGAKIRVFSKFESAGFKSLGDYELLSAILISSGKPVSDELRKALDTATATEGAEYIPTAFASEVWEKIRLEAKIASLFRFLEMPSDPYKVPISSTLPEMYLVSESLVYNEADFPESSPGTDNVTLNAKKFAIHSMYSGELVEDSIVPILPFLRDQLMLSASHGIDNVLLNGDIVTAATGNINLDDEAPVSTKNYLAMDGLRKLAIVTNTANKNDAAGAITAAKFALLRGLMAVYGINPNYLAAVVDMATYLDMVELTEVKTIDQYGPSATIRTGELAKCYGIPLIVSEEMGLTEADGKICKTPASNTKGQICMVSTRGWLGGWRRHLKIETERIITTDQWRIVGTLRFAFENFDNEVSAVSYNITV